MSRIVSSLVARSVAIVHAGRIVALDRPAALLASLGREIVELRAKDDPIAALDALRRHGVAGDDAWAIGATVTIPLHDRPAREAMDGIERAAVATASITARPPTLDDVYLQLTGEPLAA